MWQYKHTDELYHFGIPGMKWGKRNARKTASDSHSKPLTKTQKKAIKKQMKIDEYEKKIKDNDARVDVLGKGYVKRMNRVKMAAAIHGGLFGVKAIKSIGTQTMSNIAKDPKIGNGALHATSLLTAAGIGAVSVKTFKTVKNLAQDNMLADQYEYRQYAKKMQKSKGKKK